ncbi:MAG: cation-translocating P-type ATPase [Gemmatimonadales bacterium]
MTAVERRSPWRTPAASLTYASGFLWLAGSAAAFLLNAPDTGDWLRIRLDGPGIVLLSAALVGGWNFFPKAVRAVRRLRLDMNFLMTVAIIGALLIGEPIEAAAIAALFSLAELLESSAVIRARRAIEELVHLSPEHAALVRADGTEQSVPTSDLRIGHRVRVRNGEMIPIDGRIVDGESSVNQSTVTGESVPVAREPNDPVYAGTTVVEGYLEIEATTDAGDTTLDRIIRLVHQAQQRRAPIEQFVKRFARYYTPAVTVLAAATMLLPPLLGFGGGLDWFTRGLTLLVIACPCALVIATPVTVVSALTTTARHGVLVKGGEYLEALGSTCAMAFDKTGTLTTGRLTVSDTEAIGDRSPEEILALAAVVERRSEHPIARAIVELAEGRGLNLDAQVSDFEAHAGRGVVATVDGRRVRVGTPALFPDQALPSRFIELEESGKTVVLVADDGQLAGFIALADALRPEAAPVLEQLRRAGVHEQIILTGDHEAVARSIAKDLGVSDVRAGLLPQDKVAAVEELKRRHHVVAMVGDGVNDAPALAAASLGIAMGGAGSPATIETADVALMADDLHMLPYAVRVARLARRLVRFNIALALGLKLTLAAGAIGGVVTLMVAVLVGDMGASLAVTLNAMRIARMKA